MSRKSAALVCALAMKIMLLPTAALADDPRDPTMRSAAALARDRAMIRQLNQSQLAYVRQRDSRTLRTYREAQSGNANRYADARADYQRKMAAWRRAVSACNAGRWDYCDN